MRAPQLTPPPFRSTVLIPSVKRQLCVFLFLPLMKLSLRGGAGPVAVLLSVVVTAGCRFVDGGLGEAKAGPVCDGRHGTGRDGARSGSQDGYGGELEIGKTDGVMNIIILYLFLYF